jgi:hypothetical protein
MSLTGIVLSSPTAAYHFTTEETRSAKPNCNQTGNPDFRNHRSYQLTQIAGKGGSVLTAPSSSGGNPCCYTSARSHQSADARTGEAQPLVHTSFEERRDCLS